MTLTLGVAYLTVLAHERNRRAQADNLRLQSRVLTTLLEPTPLPPPQTREELAREERSSLVETAKDRWNDELENAVRWVQRTDWTEVREGMEGAISRLWSGGLQKSREGIEEAEKQAGPIAQEAVEAARRAKDQAAAGINRGAEKTVQGVEKAGAEASKIAAAAKAQADHAAHALKVKADEAASAAREQASHAGVKAGELGSAAKAKADRTSADIKTGTHDTVDAVKHSGGIIDAARGSLRDAVSKGVEMGKDAVGKAQAAVGLATDKMESKLQSSTLSHSSAVEKALHERYEKPDPLAKSVEQALQERYTPVDAKDNTHLRGV